MLVGLHWPSKAWGDEDVRSDEFIKAQALLTALFHHVLKNPSEFLEMREGEPVERLTVDFLAGMTDRYAINLYERLFLPRPQR